MTKTDIHVRVMPRTGRDGQLVAERGLTDAVAQLLEARGLMARAPSPRMLRRRSRRSLDRSTRAAADVARRIR